MGIATPLSLSHTLDTGRWANTPLPEGQAYSTEEYNYYSTSTSTDTSTDISTSTDKEGEVEKEGEKEVYVGGVGGYVWDILLEHSLNPFVNAYGTMRSAWNNNPNNYISRLNTTYSYSSTTMPGCALMSACYNSHTYESMADCVNGVTHGPVHILIGGTWGEGDLFDNRDLSFLQVL